MAGRSGPLGGWLAREGSPASGRRAWKIWLELGEHRERKGPSSRASFQETRVRGVRFEAIGSVLVERETQVEVGHSSCHILWFHVLLGIFLRSFRCLHLFCPCPVPRSWQGVRHNLRGKYLALQQSICFLLWPTSWMSAKPRILQTSLQRFPLLLRMALPARCLHCWRDMPDIALNTARSHRMLICAWIRPRVPMTMSWNWSWEHPISTSTYFKWLTCVVGSHQSQTTPFIILMSYI